MRSSQICLHSLGSRNMERVSTRDLVPQKDAFHPTPRSQGEERCCAGHPLSEHSGTVGWGQELTWLLHKVSFMSTHVTWPAATPPPAAILSALPGKAGLGRVGWGLGRAVEENPGCCPAAWHLFARGAHATGCFSSGCPSLPWPDP